MIVVIEGVDGAGKTVLARDLQTRFAGMGYMHQGPYASDPLVETITALRHWRAHERVVADRLHIGEQVYGPIYRNRDRLGAAGRRMLERWLLGRGASLVIAAPPRAVAYAAWLERRNRGKEMFADAAAWHRVYDAFGVVATSLPTLRYDYTAAIVDAVADAIIWNQSGMIPDGVPGGGSWRPDQAVLIVGERGNAAAKGRRGLPASVPPFVARGGCNEWLADRLDDAGVSEYDLYWVNARDVRGTATSAAFLDLLRPRGVIALGAVARLWCHAAGVTPIAVPHPGAWKRFHYHERYPLIDAVQEAVV